MNANSDTQIKEISIALSSSSPTKSTPLPIMKGILGFDSLFYGDNYDKNAYNRTYNYDFLQELSDDQK